MCKNLKNVILCVALSAMVLSSSSVYADDGASNVNTSVSIEESSDDSVVESDVAAETVEKFDIGASDVRRLMNLVGECDGFEIYSRDDDYKDKIQDRYGIKSDNTNSSTSKQPSESEKNIEILKKCGKLVAIDKNNIKVVAVFNNKKKCGENFVYISDAKRYTVTLSSDESKVIKVSEIVSSVDNPRLFSSPDKSQLELLDENLTEIQKSYRYDHDEDGKSVYFSDDGVDTAWLDKGKTQVLATFRCSAENDNYKMLVDDISAKIGIENKTTSYIWWSSPIGSTRDKIATSLITSQLQSSSILTYGIPSSRTEKKIRSNEEKCNISVENIENGIKVIYDYASAGIKYPVEYTLENDHMKASLKVSEIEERKSDNIATQITVLGSFGAAASDEKGYFVIPDGCGAIIDFNNGKTESSEYSQRVYGRDVTAVPTSRAAVTKQVYLPVYGIVKQDNAMLVVASKGDSNATLNAAVSVQSKSSYNVCNFSFILRGTDSYYMSGDSKTELTAFERGKINCDDIELLYYPISKENADYNDIAERYRKYLMDNENVKVKAKANTSNLYINLYGGVKKETPVLGIPVKIKKSVTSFSQAKKIVSELKSSGAENIVVSYNNWTDSGISGKVDYKAKPSSILGGRSDFKDFSKYLDSCGYQLYPSVNNETFCSGQGYYSLGSSSVRISGAYSRIVKYDMAYGIENSLEDSKSLLSPECFGKVFGDAAKNYSKNDLDGMSLCGLTTDLYGDYGKRKISRYDAKNMLIKSYKKINSKLSSSILANGANAYAFPYINCITEVPLTSSRFDVFDHDIPFYQLVIHGIIPYSTTAVNGSADSETLLLMAAATGSNLCFDMLYENVSELKDTDFDKYFYADYSGWIQTAINEYSILSGLIKSVSDAVIVNYNISDSNVITTKYSNGVESKVDINNRIISYDGKSYYLDDVSQKGGLCF